MNIPLLVASLALSLWGLVGHHKFVKESLDSTVAFVCGFCVAAGCFGVLLSFTK